MNVEDAFKSTELLDRYMKPAVEAIAEKFEKDLLRACERLEVCDDTEESTLP